MPSRREQLVDAAAAVVGEQGLRALTHRAVDAEAGLPQGSTSNLFRTRGSLVRGVLERLLEQETSAWEAVGDPPSEADDAAERVATVLAERVRLLSEDLRALTVTRFALYHEAALDPALSAHVARSRARVEEHAQRWLSELGLPLDATRVSALLSTMNGLLLERVSTGGGPHIDPAPTLRLVIGGLVSGRTTTAG